MINHASLTTGLRRSHSSLLERINNQYCILAEIFATLDPFLSVIAILLELTPTAIGLITRDGVAEITH